MLSSVVVAGSRSPAETFAKLRTTAGGSIWRGVIPGGTRTSAICPSGRYKGEWAGPWERYLVRSVVPWVDAHLPTIRSARARILGGLSAGAGYFVPFRDGPLAHATPAVLAAHDPTLLVRTAAPLLRRRGVRFFLSSGPGHDGIYPSDTVRFARELRRLHVHRRLELFRPQRHVWDRQLAAGLRWALAANHRGGGGPGRFRSPIYPVKSGELYRLSYRPVSRRFYAQRGTRPIGRTADRLVGQRRPNG